MNPNRDLALPAVGSGRGMVGELHRKTIPLSKTTKFIVDNRGRTAPTADYGIPLIATNCISNDQLYPAYEKLRYVSKETYDNWFRSHPIPGDIILTNKGSQNGAICLVPDPVDFVIAQDMVALRADEKVIDPLFLFAVLRSADVQRQIKNLDVSGVIPHFKKTDFDKLHLPYPARPVQEAIGRTYFDFCAKIELNRRMNATLEAMARALFQSWFVDFDPVRAKLDGRQPPNLDPATAALFPDSFQDSPLGHIPNGWKVEKVSDVMTFEGGTQPPASEFIDEPREGYVRLVQIRDFYTSGHVTFVPDTKKLRKFTTDDLMLARYGSSGNAAKGSDSLGRVCRGMSGAYNVALVKVIPLRPLREFLFCYLKSDAFQGTIKGMGARSVQSGFRKEDLDVIYLVTAPPQIHEAFERFAVDVWRKTYANDQESRTLATLRDTLLPKLLSGELKVQQAAQIISS
jgi:type I restriction enzyme S subunit